MIYSILVVYNKDIASSKSYDFIKNYSSIKLIVCDNSTIENKNEEKVLNDGNMYISMHGNKGLSKAYNKALKNIPYSKDDYVLLLDDDTTLTNEYIQTVFRSIETKKDVYIPIVKTSNMLMSPVISKDGCICPIKEIDQIHDSKISAINSGMLICTDVFNDYQYPEQMFLDYVDHAFMFEMNRRHKQMEVMNITVFQSFSVDEFNKIAEKNRFKIFKKDIAYYYKELVKNRKFYLYILLKRKIRLIFKYRDVRILGW